MEISMDIYLSVEDINDVLLLLAKRRCKMSMEISIDIFLSVEDIDDILLFLAKRQCKLSMEISIDILLLSVNPIRICKAFGQIFRVIKLQKRNSFHSNALLLVKVWSFGDLLTIP